MTQSYSNHAHRPMLFLVASAFAFLAVVCLVLAAAGKAPLSCAVWSLAGSVLALCWISRRYVVRLQDRIIRMEMRYRADRVLSPADGATLWTLDRAQVIALRFASDAELPALIARASKERLPAREIKQAIRDWQPDAWRT